MWPILALAVVLGAGPIPITDSVTRFPDSAFWPGAGPQRESNMLKAIRLEAGEVLRRVGPGPSQLRARWDAGQLNQAERVTVLLAGATFHSPVLLPCYAEALGSDVLRERQAAAVGLSWLMGELPPAPAAIRDNPRTWRQLRRAVVGLAEASRTRSLVGIWVDSYLLAVGVRPWGEGILRREPRQCLTAIREIAEPVDLDELVALWPFLVKDEDRLSVIRTLEIITAQRLLDRDQIPRNGLGQLQLKPAIARVDGFITSTCRSLDGERYLRRNLGRHGVLERGESETAEGWLGVLNFDYPPIWPLAAERLVAFGAPALTPNRQNPERSLSDVDKRKLMDTFPITSEAVSERKK